MSMLSYLNLSGVGDWHRAIQGVGAQLKPYRDYLWTAIRAAERAKPMLAWRQADSDEAKAFNERLKQRHAEKVRRAAESQHRRERHAPAKLPVGHWIVLEPPPGRPEEPDDTFDSFLDAEEFFDSERCPMDASCEILDYDREGLALLVERVPQPVESPEQEGNKPKQHNLIWLRPDTYVLSRQSKAVDALDNAPHRWHAPLTRLLVSRARWDDVLPKKLSEVDWVFLRRSEASSDLRDGTDEQRRFVETSLGTPDFALLEGPPGSGKTTAICELIVQLARQGKRVLLVASTHVAVDNVLERLIAWQDDPKTSEKLVLPVRIGEEGRVTSGSVEPWCYRRLLRTWQDQTRDFLERPGQADPRGKDARHMLLQAMRERGQNGDSPISKLLLESSNLVCGTTIGILQHPAIKEASRNGESFEPFDVMILDEASKTTFAEFLVPAMHAKRWVIVGDVRQLSPYVETQYLEDNLRGLLPQGWAEAAHHAFQAKKSPRWVAVSDDRLRTALDAECRARGIPFVDLDAAQPRELRGVAGAIPELLYADLIFGRPETMRRFQHRLPVDVELGGKEFPHLEDWEAAHEAWLGTRKDSRPREEQDWAVEVAWRLVRSYELRRNAAELLHLDHEVQDLIPKGLNGDLFAFRGTKATRYDGSQRSAQEEIQRDFRGLRRCAFPSILELLQAGFERVSDRHEAVALTDGLPKEDLEQRMVSLSFQHRMHPDISAFPRNQFYATNNHHLLQDASGMPEKRTWSFSRHKHRAVWLEVTPHRGVRGKNENPAEAEAVLGELRAFVDWAKSNPRSDGQPWEVAVLTFYRGQEKLLRVRLQQLSRAKGNTRNFKLPASGSAVHVTLCTVDRFQGHEADLVLLSFVKSGTVGFLNSPNRLNVAITRARYQLVLVGHRAFFASDRCRSELLRALAQSPHYPAGIAY